MRVEIALALALGSAACATVGEPVSPPGPPAFQGVRRVALVRSVEYPTGQRAKDALDALRQSLEERGYEARLVEVGPAARDKADLWHFFSRVQSRIGTGGRNLSGSVFARAEGSAASILAALGVDSLVMVHRFDGLPPPLPLRSPFDPPSAGSAFDSREPYRAIGALSLVDRAGNLVWFEWGTPESSDPGAPANAAEAVDAALGVLSGKGTDEP